jgi:hypothetical protein
MTSMPVNTSITSEQWDFYIKKYGKLMWTVARKISGDDAIASVDDNYADLCIAAIASINSYAKKENLTVDEILPSVGFGKYTKTVLWNLKAKKGIPLTIKMPFRNSHVSIDAMVDEGQSSFDIEDTRLDLSSTLVLDDMFRGQDQSVSSVIDSILKDPSVLSSTGNIVLSSVSKATGLSINATKKAVGSIERILNKNYGNQDE